MTRLKRASAFAAALLVVAALAAASAARHGHGPDAQGDAHADCDACRFGHLSVIETDRAPAPCAPDLVAHAVSSVRPQGERGAALGIRPNRGPPA